MKIIYLACLRPPREFMAEVRFNQGTSWFITQPFNHYATLVNYIWMELWTTYLYLLHHIRIWQNTHTHSLMTWLSNLNLKGNQTSHVKHEATPKKIKKWTGICRSYWFTKLKKKTSPVSLGCGEWGGERSQKVSLCLSQAPKLLLWLWAQIISCEGNKQWSHF